MIPWTRIAHFTKQEFPEDPDLYAAPELILALDRFRKALGFPVHPSPARGALARLDGPPSSRHFARGRKSDAVDVFCDGPPLFAWALGMTMFGGVGLYLDTTFRGRSWTMLHLDVRGPERTFWVRDPRGYAYPLGGEAACKTFAAAVAAVAVRDR